MTGHSVTGLTLGPYSEKLVIDRITEWKAVSDRVSVGGSKTPRSCRISKKNDPIRSGRVHERVESKR